MNTLFVCLVLLAQLPTLPAPTQDASLQTEREYQIHIRDQWYPGAKIEDRLADGTRIDISTDIEAIEVDFARKWYEAVGQSTHYALSTGKKPVMLLIVEKPEDERYIEAAQRATRYLRLWISKRSSTENSGDRQTGGTWVEFQIVVFRNY